VFVRSGGARRGGLRGGTGAAGDGAVAGSGWDICDCFGASSGRGVSELSAELAALCPRNTAAMFSLSVTQVSA